MAKLLILLRETLWELLIDELYAKVLITLKEDQLEMVKD